MIYTTNKIDKGLVCYWITPKFVRERSLMKLIMLYMDTHHLASTNIIHCA